MKYSDIKYYIDKYKLGYGHFNNIKYIMLPEALFWDIAEQVCESYFEVYDSFTYDNFKFKLEKDFKFKNYMLIVDVNGTNYRYNVLSENERIIKELLE